MPTQQQQALIKKSSTALADFKAKVAAAGGSAAGAPPTTVVRTVSGAKRFPVVAVHPSSTKDVTIAEQALDETDKAFAAGDSWTDDERKLLSSLHAFSATTSVGGAKMTIPIRCIAAPKASKIMLCLHGQDGDRSLVLWSRFWPHLLAKGFHVVALDLPGFGRASGKDGDYKSWKEHDATLLLQLLAALQLPDQCVSVFAEGVGAMATVRAMAKDSAPFAPHHVLMNCNIGEVPAGLLGKLDEIQADLGLYMTECFYAGQSPAYMSGNRAIMEFVFDPATGGRVSGAFGTWHVRKDADGKDAKGPSPFVPTHPDSWCVGKKLSLAGAARSAKALIFLPSQECVEEVLAYITSPARKVESEGGSIEKSAIEMGEINDNFQVFIRVRPLNKRETEAGVKNVFTISDIDFPRVPPPQRIVVQEGGDKAKGNFVFNRVFDSSYDQAAVYQATAQPYVLDFIKGTNVTLFAYGQTGTGKTHTIAGPKDNPGLIQRCLSEIFAALPASGKKLSFEYVQLYMEDFKDLLLPDTEAAVPLKIQEHPKQGVQISGLTRQVASSCEHVVQALEEAAPRRAVRAQGMNEVSSRSHAILILRLSPEGSDAFTSSLFIVDLAGSERIGKPAQQSV